MATRTRKVPARKPAKGKAGPKRVAAMRASPKKSAAPAARKATKARAKPAPAAPGRGRPTKYDPALLPVVSRFCEMVGGTDVEIADLLGIEVRTLYRWKAEHPEFCQALKLHKAPADNRVETRLFQRAIGYEVDETDIRVINGKIVKTTVRKHYPPDPTSMIFWLKNRKSTEWRQQPDPADGSDDAPPPVNVTVQVVDARKPGSDAQS